MIALVKMRRPSRSMPQGGLASTFSADTPIIALTASVSGFFVSLMQRSLQATASRGLSVPRLT